MFDPEDNMRPSARRARPDAPAGGMASPRQDRRHGSTQAAPSASLLDLLSGEADQPAPAPAPAAARTAKFVSPAPVAVAALVEPAEARPGVFRRVMNLADRPRDDGVSRRNNASAPTGSMMLGNDPDSQAHPELYEDDTREKPLLDLRIVFDSVWQVRKLIIATTVLGAIGGVLIAMSTPSAYVAESKLYIDPREVRLTDSDLSKESLATEAILALIDSQLEVLRSRTVLEKVAVDLGLERDAEFGIDAANSGGFSGGVSVIRSLLSAPAPRAAPDEKVNPATLEKLSNAVSVSRDPKTFIVTVNVKSRDPAKSALIANRLVSTFLSEEMSAQSSFFQRTTAALDNQLSGLRQELDTAENAVEAYKAEHDIIGASGELIADKQLILLNEQVAVAGNRVADARARVEVASRTQLNDVVGGAFPEELTSVTLSELRKQFTAARTQLGSLDASLGPRHPQRLAAVQAVEVARAEIGNELRRIEATSQTELQRALRAEQDLVQMLAVQKTRQVGAAAGFVELRELERKANATRVIYESFLKRASETGQEEKLTSKNIRVISQAEPPVQPTGPSRKLIVIAGIVLGAGAGIGLGVLLGVIRSLKIAFSPSRRAMPAEPAPVLMDAQPAAVAQAAPVHQVARSRRAASPSMSEVPAVETVAAERREVERRPAPVQRARPAFDDGAAAAEAARAAARRNDNDEWREYERAETIDDVQQNLRALRTRVEHYARQRSAGGRR